MSPPMPLTAQVRSCRRAGPVALAHVPMSFKLATPPRPALTRNPTPNPKFGLRKQMRGGNQNPLPSAAGIWSGRAGLLQAGLLKGVGNLKGGGGKGPRVSREDGGIRAKNS